MSNCESSLLRPTYSVHPFSAIYKNLDAVTVLFDGERRLSPARMLDGLNAPQVRFGGWHSTTRLIRCTLHNSVFLSCSSPGASADGRHHLQDSEGRCEEVRGEQRERVRYIKTRRYKY